MATRWREKVARWHNKHVGITEQPPGSNTDQRRDGIRAAQDGCANGTWLRGQPWCGCWAWAGLHAAGVLERGAYWMASVAAIENRARKGWWPFKMWTMDRTKVKRGDLVVLFGHGIHVETVRRVGRHHLYTWGGNTSSGNGGSQSNGGGAYRRVREYSQVHGFAILRERRF